uniref:Macaca fascicularis brain cDNA clone: QflA-21007, similar to human FGD1 family, member 4 (FGD4), mRNA, RefSeq: NM_139241.1 n=1 Tax=Macaca fascicularis TaxID=9541 RepID=I7GD13_MACFA|nr:unnamed protein product [Macaca fascicularis]
MCYVLARCSTVGHQLFHEIVCLGICVVSLVSSVSLCVILYVLLLVAHSVGRWISGLERLSGPLSLRFSLCVFVNVTPVGLSPPWGRLFFPSHFPSHFI